MTAAHSYLEARSTVGTVPMLWPYRMMFSGLTPYLEGSQRVHAVSDGPKTEQTKRLKLTKLPPLPVYKDVT